MGQRSMPVAAGLAVALLGACDRGRTVPTTRPAAPTIASTVPAVTDLIVGMGARDRLVAVSNYDRGRPDVGTLPKAGDYQTVDWELLATLRPTTLVTFIADDRLPAGFARQAAALHVRPLNVNLNRLSDLDPALTKLGDALAEPDLARAAVRRVDERLEAIRRAVIGRPTVSALVVLGPDATAVAGTGTYLDDVLYLAGGTNAAAPLRRPWPQVDPELFASLHPTVVLQLLPDAPPQERAAAAAVWAHRPRVRVCPIYDAYALQPGWHLPDLAQRFAECLHPTAAR